MLICDKVYPRGNIPRPERHKQRGKYIPRKGDGVKDIRKFEEWAYSIPYGYFMKNGVTRY